MNFHVLEIILSVGQGKMRRGAETEAERTGSRLFQCIMERVMNTVTPVLVVEREKEVNFERYIRGRFYRLKAFALLPICVLKS